MVKTGWNVSKLEFNMSQQRKKGREKKSRSREVEGNKERRKERDN